jgi:adenosylhomocysteine nucleosidase
MRIREALASPNMNTLVCFALKEEAAPFRTGLRRGHQVSIILTGIGRANAERAIREFLGSALASGAAVDASSTARANDGASFATREGARAPQLVLTCGFAGGLNPNLKLGEVIFEIPNRRDEFHESQTKTGVRDSQSSSLRSELVSAGAKPAKFFCADRIAVAAAEKKKLREQTGADAVEMESAAIHAVCAERGISCATVRVISDTANEDLPLDFNALAKPDKNLDYGKLFAAIAKSPGKIGALIALQKKTKFAAEQLATVLEKITFP